MNLKDAAKTGYSNFKKHKVRTLLSILGIVVGILSVTLIVSLGQGVKGYVTSQVNAFGNDIIDVAIKVPGKGNVGTLTSMAQGINITSLKREDFEAIEKFDFVEAQASYNVSQDWASYKNKENRSFLIASGADYLKVDRQAKIDKGRFFTEAEDKGAKRVAVIGSNTKEELFGEEDPIGKNIRIKGKSFKVIGIMKERGQVGGFNFDNLIGIPLKTGQKIIMGTDHVTEGLVKVKSGTNMDLAVSRIESLLRRRHNISDPDKDDFQVISMEEAAEIASVVTNALNLLLILLAGISLLVGGIGVMNTQLLSMSERIREIGLRKAFGAKDRDILIQFLVESVLLTTIGGIIGIFLGLILTLTASLLAYYFGAGWSITFPVLGFLIALLVSVLTGIIFGIYPAQKASRLDPIEAIKEE
ncbi:MAG: ABC transporter permease [Minisyncoccales bacterium]